MKKYFRVLVHVEVLVLYDVVVVVHAVFKVVVVSGQMGVNEAHRAAIQAQPDAYSPLVTLRKKKHVFLT